MDTLQRLQENMKSESEAYGYTLSVWGSGALLLQGFNLEAFHVLVFVLGGVAGFGLLALIAFRDIMKQVDAEPSENILTGSMIHILSSLGTVLISYGLIVYGGGLELVHLTGLIGFNTTFSYNVLLLVESLVYKDLFTLERKFVQG